jgi:hypothetical protein
MGDWRLTVNIRTNEQLYYIELYCIELYCIELYYIECINYAGRRKEREKMKIWRNQDNEEGMKKGREEQKKRRGGKYEKSKEWKKMKNGPIFTD